MSFEGIGVTQEEAADFVAKFEELERASKKALQDLSTVKDVIRDIADGRASPNRQAVLQIFGFVDGLIRLERMRPHAEKVRGML